MSQDCSTPTFSELPKLSGWKIEKSSSDGEVRLHGVITGHANCVSGEVVRTSPVRAIAFLEAPRQSLDRLGWQPDRLGAFTDHTLYDLGNCSDAYELVSTLAMSGVNLPVHFLKRAV